MHFFNLGITILLFGIGWFIKFRKATWLISGYNTASKEKKEEYDIDKLTNLVGNFLYALAGIWGVMTLLGLLYPKITGIVIIVGTIVFTIACLIFAVWLNSGDRVKKK